MRKSRSRAGGAPRGSDHGIATLVISQHDAVRRQLVSYLSHSLALAVSGDAFSPEAIVLAHPDVLVLDLSQLAPAGLRQAIDATRRVGAHLIALASMREEADERAVAARQWRWQMSLLAAACVAFLAIAGGLMFWVNEVDAGLLVVSHLVALGAGAVAAARWTRRTFEGTRDRM